MPNAYLDRYAYPQQVFEDEPSPDLGLIVIIPCFNEPNLIGSLEALRACQAPKGHVELIVVVNGSEAATVKVVERNEHTYQEARLWADKWNTDHFKVLIIYIDSLPTKHAGVGLARKIAMDEAVRRFEAIGNADGIIACFDADCTCQPNYLVALEDHFQQHPTSPGCSIHFEHPLNGENTDAIIYYELFLRYYVHALRYAGFPYAYQTIGSSMAVRSWAYQKQGGMNRRKAGEDFYFLHRIIPLGGFTELNQTKVIPSDRFSDRVPFGTGRAMLDWQGGKKDLTKIYHPQTFKDLKVLIDHVDHLFKEDTVDLPETVRSFLNTIQFDQEISRIRKHSNNLDTFRKHFFQWYDGFKVLKYVHHVRDGFYEPMNIVDATNQLINYDAKTALDCLTHLRDLDQNKT